jgi:hypothetical protein
LLQLWVYCTNVGSEVENIVRRRSGGMGGTTLATSTPPAMTTFATTTPMTTTHVSTTPDEGGIEFQGEFVNKVVFFMYISRNNERHIYLYEFIRKLIICKNYVAVFFGSSIFFYKDDDGRKLKVSEISQCK